MRMITVVRLYVFLYNGGETNVMSSFSLSVRRSSVCFTVSNGEKQTSCYHSHCLYVVSPSLETAKHTDERRTDNENDDMTFVSPPLETIKHTDDRRPDNENDDMTFVSPH
jgi:hypothetical protein